MPHPLGHGASAGVSEVHCLRRMSMRLDKCVSRMARLLLRSPHRAARLCVSDFQESCAQHPREIAPNGCVGQRVTPYGDALQYPHFGLAGAQVVHV